MRFSPGHCIIAISIGTGIYITAHSLIIKDGKEASIDRAWRLLEITTAALLTAYTAPKDKTDS